MFLWLPTLGVASDVQELFDRQIADINSKNDSSITNVFREPLFDADRQSFVAFAESKLANKTLTDTERIYLLHQLMRYYVSVEADFDQSFIYLVDVIKLLESKASHPLRKMVLGDTYFIAYWINQIQHDLPKARLYIEKCLDHAVNYKMEALIIKAKMSLAELTQHEGNVASGIAQFKSIEAEIVEKNDSILLNRLYLLLSNAYTVYEDSDSAFYFAKQAYALVPNTNAQLKAFSSIHLARGYMATGDINQAIRLTTEALNVVEDLEAKKEIKDLHNFLAEAHKGAGNFEKAFHHLENFIALDKEQASLLSAANISNLEKKLSDEKHDFEIKLKQTELSQKNKQTIALGIFLFFALIFIAVVVKGYQKKKKDAEIIRNQKTLVEEKNKEITDSITYAKRIQNAILPPQKVVKSYLENSFILYKPKDIVAGDFYWMETIPGLVPGSSKTKEEDSMEEIPELAGQGDIILFAAADCTGHGVPGAMVSVICNNGLNRSVREHGLTDPGKILDKTREIVIQEFEKSEEEVKDGMDIALCSLQFMSSEEKKVTAILKYAGAHNPLWILRDCQAEPIEVLENSKVSIFRQTQDEAFVLTEIKANKQPIGKHDNPNPYTTHTIELTAGDSFYIFSDGFADQFGGEKGKKMKTVNFKKLLISIQNESMDKQRELINNAFEQWKGDHEQLDDVCVIGVRI